MIFYDVIWCGMSIAMILVLYNILDLSFHAHTYDTIL